MRRFAGWFGVVVGTCIAGMWIVFFASSAVPEVRTAPIALGFHLAAEALTAFTLVTSGVGLLLGTAAARQSYRVGIGMLLYTSIVSAGYFAQRGEWAFLGMFAVIVVLALFALRDAKLRG